MKNPLFPLPHYLIPAYTFLASHLPSTATKMAKQRKAQKEKVKVPMENLPLLMELLLRRHQEEERMQLKVVRLLHLEMLKPVRELLRLKSRVNIMLLT